MKPCCRWWGKAGVIRHLHVLGHNWYNSEPEHRVAKHSSQSSGRMKPLDLPFETVSCREVVLWFPTPTSAPTITNILSILFIYLSPFSSSILEEISDIVLFHSHRILILLGLSNNKYPLFITRKPAMLSLIQMWYRMLNYSRAVIPVK